MITPRTLFHIGDDEYYFEIEPPLYTHLPLQVLDEEHLRWEDRFHRTVRIVRIRDGRSWIAAADFHVRYMNQLTTHLKQWLEDCFARWGADAIPPTFEMPQ